VELNGRVIDTSCPFMSQCWGDQACAQDCPDTLIDVLRNTARLEHENDLVPHTDPDVFALCTDRRCSSGTDATSGRGVGGKEDRHD